MPDPSPYPAPTSAADPRPDGKPYYIDPLCPTCGVPLVLMDALVPTVPVWHDEWACPMCRDGTLHMDWPPEEWAKLYEAADASEPATGST